MSRYRLESSREQEEVLLRHCSDARYVWNLAVEQHAWWRPGRSSAPGYLEQARQLTAARAASPWLREGSQVVQQQALRDFAQAMANFFQGDAPQAVVAQGRAGRGVPGRRDRPG
ncbi:MAG TPA: helix-turn-helix domain-containing protein [Trebonia sp.]